MHCDDDVSKINEKGRRERLIGQRQIHQQQQSTTERRGSVDDDGRVRVPLCLSLSGSGGGRRAYYSPSYNTPYDTHELLYCRVSIVVEYES